MYELPEFIRQPNPEKFLNGTFCVLDFETTNNYYGDPNYDNSIVIAVGYSSIDDSYQLFYRDLRSIEKLLAFVEAHDFLVAHNAKFEVKWLAHLGLDTSKLLVYCTQIGEYVLSGNRRLPLSLEATGHRRKLGGKLSLISMWLDEGICPSTMPRSVLINYCYRDVELCLKIFLQQRQELYDNKLLNCHYTRCLLICPLVDIERRGLALDADRVYAEYERATKELAAIEKEIDDFTGGINPRSPKQLKEFIYSTLGFKPTKDSRGNEILSTDKKVLQRLKATTKKQQQFLDLKFRHGVVNAEVTKTLNAFKAACDAQEILYANFNQTVTQTHRLSSSGTKFSVQFQNFPRKFKKLIKARYEKWYVAEPDGAQLEFRVAAYLGQDSTAARDIRQGTDVHSFTASILTEAGQPTTRQDAKAHTFKPLYGGQSGTKAEQAYYEAFKTKYSGIAKAQQEWKYEVLAKKCLRIPSGLVFYWPDTRMDRSGYITNSTSICNYPVQSLATADIIPIGLVYLWHHMRARGMESFLVCTVHDSVAAEIHPDEVELFAELSVKALTSDVYWYLNEIYDIQFNVPLGAGFKIGTHWSESSPEPTDMAANRLRELGYEVKLDKGEIKVDVESEWTM